MAQVKNRKERKKITKTEAHRFAEIGNSLARVVSVSLFKEENTSPRLNIFSIKTSYKLKTGSILSLPENLDKS
jgi:hypothetical protein